MKTEKIFSSIYQDVYRLFYGVLLLVNKFNTVGCDASNFKTKQYYPSKYLRVLKEDAIDPITRAKFPKGTIMYEGKPVRLVNQEKWVYELKISGGVCVGTADEMRELGYKILDLTEFRNRDSPQDDWKVDDDE